MNSDCDNLRENIRSYNNAVFLASICAKTVAFRARGPYNFKAQAHICYRTSHMQSINGDHPQYAELYIIKVLRRQLFQFFI